jgi:tRNA-2-methylthio-N6-dimethylallyladenosine synthase
MSTDLIVGFCGETEAQFENSLKVLDELRFDKVHVAAYSPRPGTIAWRHMEDTVPQAEKMRRLHAVEALQERIATELNAMFLDTEQEVLVEGAKEADDGETVYTGRNRANKLVHFRTGSALGTEVSIGDLVSVYISKTTPWSLQGELAGAAVTAQALSHAGP